MVFYNLSRTSHLSCFKRNFPKNPHKQTFGCAGLAINAVMKLSQLILFTVNIYQASSVALPNATFFPNSTATSSLSLDAFLQPLNLTHIKVSIPNTYSQDISILRWHSHFHETAEHGSFRVTHEVNGSLENLQAGPGMRIYNFGKALPSDFVKISAKTTYTGIFDLTALFKVPADGKYNVTVKLGTRAYQHGTNTTLNRALDGAGRYAQKLPMMQMSSKPISMTLKKSQQSMQKRQSSEHFANCDLVGYQDEVDTARSNAASLAKAAQGISNNDLWNLYFNSSTAQQTVSTVFQGIINYNDTNMRGQYDVTEQCDTGYGARDTGCQNNPGALAYADRKSIIREKRVGGRSLHCLAYPDGSWVLQLCPSWFSVPAASSCDFPSGANPDMYDQGGIFLHELTHVKTLNGGINVLDGSGDHTSCYDW